MTLEEKSAQLCTAWVMKDVADEQGRFDPTKAAKIFGGGIGGFGPVRLEIEAEVAFRNTAQQFVRENTRHGIPLLFHEEACHGVLAPQANSFPVPIGLASSWNPELIEQVFRVVSAEMRSRGAQQALTPIADICRDPRWGRTDEMIGEDPYLVGTLATAMVRGLQGDANAISPDQVAATIKHFVGHGAPQGGINRGPAHLGMRELQELHLEPFRMVCAAAPPALVMMSYNEIDGIPSHANRWLIQDVLRKQFGFKGIVTSDYFGMKDLMLFHNLVANETDSALLAFQSGVEMDLPDGIYFPKLPALVKAGKISLSQLDEAVARVLRLKFQMGLFESIFADAAKAKALANLESTRVLARKAAGESMVLLKNHNDLLPLNPQTCGKIAVIGPHANDTRLGSYSGEPAYRVSLVDGIRQSLGDPARVLHAKGCSITKNETLSPFQAWRWVDVQEYPTEAENKADISAALEIAKQADTLILVLGENEMLCREAWADNHLGDRSSLGLMGAQQQLADAMFALGKPTIVYLMNGRPLAIPSVIEKAGAVIEGWYAGQETGTAAADILFGKINPSGKLTITFPRSVGQIPISYDQKPSAVGFAYIEEERKPLFPFGFGLSYTRFSYENPTTQPSSIAKGGKTVIHVKVTNTGTRSGTEVVQLYVRDLIASVTRPVRQLKGFQRVTLEPGASKIVEFQLAAETLAFYDTEMNYLVEPGDFEISVGGDSDTKNSTRLSVF
ncbi:MAG: glycoside hydrolase family 3 C-terminal domain-containing protein [Gloeobacteraceae cyanobacterium ES-bin-144]|nr:glycoside hydrolase family 3 C-terminal domain-containing protein [Verrucomicrobiales bacterium]